MPCLPANRCLDVTRAGYEGREQAATQTEHDGQRQPAGKDHRGDAQSKDKLTKSNAIERTVTLASPVPSFRGSRTMPIVSPDRMGSPLASRAMPGRLFTIAKVDRGSMLMYSESEPVRVAIILAGWPVWAKVSRMLVYTANTRKVTATFRLMAQQVATVTFRLSHKLLRL
jgi:hypothetical protein